MTSEAVRRRDDRPEAARPARPSALLSVGLFGRRTRLSRKALRIYDDRDLLRPAWVDTSTGYRYYRPDQAERALRIRLLRDLGMPLDLIRRVLDAPAPAALALVDHWWADEEARVRAGRELVAYLHRRMDQAEDVMTLNVTLQQVPAQHVLARSANVALDGLDRHLRDSIGALRRAAAASGVEPAGEPFAIYRGEVAEEQDGEVEVCLPVRTPLAGRIATRRLPATAAAVAEVPARDADYPQVLGAYDAVAGWAQAQGRRLIDDPREVYLREPGEHGYAADPGDAPVLRLVWPVE